MGRLTHKHTPHTHTNHTHTPHTHTNTTHTHTTHTHTTQHTHHKHTHTHTHTHCRIGCKIGRMCFPFQIFVAENTQSEYLISLLYYGKCSFANALQRYVKLILTLLFLSFHIPVTTSRSTNFALHFPFPSKNNNPHTTPSRK